MLTHPLQPKLKALRLSGMLTTLEDRANVGNKVTLLTHCHKCKHYPLIIRKNSMCNKCKGLVCEWRGAKDPNRCKSCKKTCGEGQRTSESQFV